MSEKTIDAMPKLVITYPTCGNCHNEVEIEDGLVTCSHCLIQWDGVDEDAVPHPNPNIEGTDVVCGVYSKAYRIGRFRSMPCSLPAAHTGGHHHPWAYDAGEVQAKKGDQRD